MGVDGVLNVGVVLFPGKRQSSCLGSRCSFLSTCSEFSVYQRRDWICEAWMGRVGEAV